MKKTNTQNTINLTESLIPILILVSLLAYNIFFKEGHLLGEYSNQYILLISALVALIVGINRKIKISTIFKVVSKNIKSVKTPILILLMVGALAGTWLVSGVIPAMVYYGLQILNPSIFLPASVIISAIISIATGSSWTTSATVGVALVGIGSALNIPQGMIAGAVISGAYFGDKMSPLSDTTNLAPAMAGTDIFTHIKYMTYTTIPTITISLIVFSILSMSMETTGNSDISELLNVIDSTFNINIYLFSVPCLVVLLIVLKTKPIVALVSGTVLAIIVSLFFQEEVLNQISINKSTAIIQSVFTDINISTSNITLNELFTSSGMQGMLGTIFLIVSSMVLGGIMEAIGALSKITASLLKLSSSIFGLFASTSISCLGLNIVASDQYLSIVIPGKMFKDAYEEKNLAPENLSRTLEDTATVTSVLIPWNTCGAYQSRVLGVKIEDYFIFAIFNWLSPIMTLIFAFFKIKIRMKLKK